MVVGQGHIVIDANRPVGGNSRRQPVGEAGQATLADPSVGSTRTLRFFAVIIR
jgi:hypothetical protein